MVTYIRRFLNWLLSFFQKSETPEIDAKIEENKKQIKDIDEKLKVKYDDVESAKDEWK